MRYTKEIKIHAEGETKEDLLIAIEEAILQIKDGYLMGSDGNESSRYRFDIT